MSKRKSDRSAADSSDVTSAGIRWAEVGDDFLYMVEWMDGRYGSAKQILPSIDQTPVPAVLLNLPHLPACVPAPTVWSIRLPAALIDIFGVAGAADAVIIVRLDRCAAAGERQNAADNGMPGLMIGCRL
jgi:hypothetical protein